MSDAEINSVSSNQGVIAPRSHASTNTPFFLVWAVVHSCDVRSEIEPDVAEVSPNSPDSPGAYHDLLQLERLLRPLRELSLATHENRCHEGICILQHRDQQAALDSIMGFEVAEVTAAFGGFETLKKACLSCRANIPLHFTNESNSTPTPSFAGCFGCLQESYDGLPLFQQWQQALIARENGAPGNNGDSGNSGNSGPGQLCELWQRNLLASGQVLNRWQLSTLEWLLNDTHRHHEGVADTHRLESAIARCLQDELPLQVHTVPAGIIRHDPRKGRRWIVPQHCSNCAATVESWPGECPACGSDAAPNPERKRFVRGNRPYWPLVRFLGIDAARSFAQSYFEPKTEK